MKICKYALINRFQGSPGSLDSAANCVALRWGGIVFYGIGRDGGNNPQRVSSSCIQLLLCTWCKMVHCNETRMVLTQKAFIKKIEFHAGLGVNLPNSFWNSKFMLIQERSICSNIGFCVLVKTILARFRGKWNLLEPLKYTLRCVEPLGWTEA